MGEMKKGRWHEWRMAIGIIYIVRKGVWTIFSIMLILFYRKRMGVWKKSCIFVGELR